jgi:hypothetical protein
MSVKQFKRVCECKNCGNEAEMVITCSLEEAPPAREAAPVAPPARPQTHGKIKGHAVCSHCGGEADIWLDL